MWTMPSRPAQPINTKINPIYNSPFTKMKKTNQNSNKKNIIYQANPNSQIKTIQDNQPNNSPFKFDVNLFFGNQRSSFTPRHPIENYYYYNNNNLYQNMPICLLFKISLEKSGYRLPPEQIVQYNDVYKKYNYLNNYNENNNNYYFPTTREYREECPMKSNNNIITNIFPTFTKVTNVQILSDNENSKNNLFTEDNKYNNNKTIESLDNKKENIQSNNNIIKKDSTISTTISNKEEKNNINNIILNVKKSNNITNNENGNKKQKVLFECSESNTPNTPLISKNFTKKKRLRKNNKQIELLSKFYMENKNWSKKQIKEISEIIGLKENKIYKWLWDQKNKEFKITKFVVNKDNDKLVE